MSDVGIVFPWWFILGVALMIALPVTTAIMVGLGVAASRARRRGRARRLAGLKWSASIVAPFWLPGLAFGGWYVVSEIRERIYEARRYFTLDKAREVDGIAFPAGTWVALDADEALKEAELPAGETVRLRAAAWQGKLEFAAPAHAPNAAHGRITDGTLATPAELDGIPCRAGDRATFFWSGRLMECTLSRDADLSTTITAPDGAAQVRKLRCMAGEPMTDRVWNAGILAAILRRKVFTRYPFALLSRAPCHHRVLEQLPAAKRAAIKVDPSGQLHAFDHDKGGPVWRTDRGR